MLFTNTQLQLSNLSASKGFIQPKTIDTIRTLLNNAYDIVKFKYEHSDNIPLHYTEREKVFLIEVLILPTYHNRGFRQEDFESAYLRFRIVNQKELNRHQSMHKMTTLKNALVRNK